MKIILKVAGEDKSEEFDVDGGDIHIIELGTSDNPPTHEEIRYLKDAITSTLNGEAERIIISGLPIKVMTILLGEKL